MDNGRIIKWERLEWRVAIDGSTSVSVGAVPLYQISGSLYSSQAQVVLGTPTVVPGITLACGSRNYTPPSIVTVSPSHWYTLTIPGLYDTTVSSAGWDGTLETHIEIDNFTVYAIGGMGGWRVTWDELRWYIEGSLQATLGAFSRDETHFVPASIPLFGIPSLLTPLATYGTEPASVPIGGSPSYFLTPTNQVAFVTVEGGWRFKEPGGSYVALPVTLELFDPPAAGCSAATPPDISITTTYDGSVSARQSLAVEEILGDPYQCIPDCPPGQQPLAGGATVRDNAYIGTYESSSGAVRTLPDILRHLIRLNSDYAALIERGGFPQDRAIGDASCRLFVDDVDISPTPVSATAVVHPRATALLSTVTNDPHVIEDPMEEVLYAPYSWATRRIISRLYEREMLISGCEVIEGEV